MTNFASVAGGMIWVAVASLLMLATLEPVSRESKAIAAPAFTLAAAGETTTTIA